MPAGRQVAEPVAVPSHHPEAVESRPLVSEVAEDPVQPQPLDSFSAVSGPASIDETRKEPRENTSAQAAPQTTRKTLYIIAALAFLVVLVLLATQHRSFDRWQDQWSAWWVDFSTPRPPQKNSGLIPRIPDEPEIQLPVGSAQSAVSPGVVPDSKTLDTETPQPLEFNSEDLLTPEAEFLSSPVDLPDSEGQLGKAWEGAGTNADDAVRGGALQVDDMMLIDESVSTQQEVAEGDKSVAAEAAVSAVSLAGESGALDAIEDGVAPVTEQAWQVEFDFDSAELSSASADVVGQAFQYMSNIEGSIALIAGYSDNLGADQYNLSLSQRRAETVARYLADRGVSRARLRVEGRGAIRVSASAETDGFLSNYKEWRIVEIRISAPSQP